MNFDEFESGSGGVAQSFGFLEIMIVNVSYGGTHGLRFYPKEPAWMKYVFQVSQSVRMDSDYMTNDVLLETEEMTR